MSDTENNPPAERRPIRRKLLLIDDDPAAHSLLRIIMDVPPPVEIELISALSFEGGLRLLEQEPDICLLDLNLSATMKAPQTLEAMREHLADVLPTLIITGQLDEGGGIGKLWKQSRAAGAVGFLRKDRYLDPKNREFLLHEITDGMLEFEVRRTMGFHFPALELAHEISS